MIYGNFAASRVGQPWVWHTGEFTMENYQGLETHSPRSNRPPSRLAQGLMVLGALIIALSIGQARGIFDPSDPTGPFIGDLPPGLTAANEGAFEGGLTGTHSDAGINIVIGEAELRQDPLNLIEFNIPTDVPPSPLFGAQPFTQAMLRFEEFGTEAMPATFNTDPPFPTLDTTEYGPKTEAVDNFLSAEMFPGPSRWSNYEMMNPWKTRIEGFLGRTMLAPPMEGRPPGEGWAHQRWEEFYPQVYYKTAQAGVRTNRGMRDAVQRHGFSLGEFGPVRAGRESETGLYNNSMGLPGFDGTCAGIEPRFHPNMPIQDPNALWTFDGTFPPKLLMARYGEPVLMRHYN